MKKLLALNAAALAMSALLAVILVQTTTTAGASLADMAGLAEEVDHAQAIRKEMLVMGDSMRGFLLDPTQQKEWDAKMAADDALSKSVDARLASTEDPTRKQMAGQVGDFDESQLNPSENRVLEAAKTDRAKATQLYFNEYPPLRIKQMRRWRRCWPRCRRTRTRAPVNNSAGSIRSSGWCSGSPESASRCAPPLWRGRGGRPGRSRSGSNRR